MPNRYMDNNARGSHDVSFVYVRIYTQVSTSNRGHYTHLRLHDTIILHVRLHT